MKLYYLSESINIENALDVGKTLFPKAVLEHVMKKKGKSKERSALAYLLLRYSLKKEGKGDFFEKIEFTSLGKPFASGVEFSLSHTRGMIVCAVSDVSVGVDVEKVRPIPKYAVKKFMDENKLALYEGIEDKDLFAIREWVIKESWLKDIGTGARKRLKCVVPSLISDNVWRIEGHKIAIFNEGEYVIGVSSKKGIPKKLTRVSMRDVM